MAPSKETKAKQLQARYPVINCASRGHLISCMIDTICAFMVMSPNKDVDSEFITDKDMLDLMKMNIMYVLRKKYKGYENIPREELDNVEMHMAAFIRKYAEEHKKYL